jgi:hypothetical protein
MLYQGKVLKHAKSKFSQNKKRLYGMEDFMKKIICLALALIMCMFVLASCSKQETKFGKEYRPLSAQMDVLLQLNA